MGIDRLRMDKFYLLVRNMLEVSIKFLKSKEWDVGIVDWLLSILKNGPISPVPPYSGMHYHFCDIYLEELAKVAAGTMSSDMIMKFLDPYCIFITKAKNNDLVRLAITEIFEQLIENSKPALDLLAEEEDDELIVEIRSHTQLPASDASPVASLTVDYNALADRIFNLASEENVLAKSKKKAFILVGKFRELSEGRLPLDDVPDAEYSSEDELAKMECSLVKKIVKKDSDEFCENHHSKKTPRNKHVGDYQEEASVVEPIPDEPDVKASGDVSQKLVTKDKDTETEKLESTVPHKAVTKKGTLKSSALKKRKRKKSIEVKKKSLESPIEDSHVQSQPDDLKCTIKNSSVCQGDGSSDTALVSDNMPDLIQDVEKCVRVAESSTNNSTPSVTDAAELPEAPCIKKSKGVESCNSHRVPNKANVENGLPMSNKGKRTKKLSRVSAPNKKAANGISQTIKSSTKREKSFDKSTLKGRDPDAIQCEDDVTSVPVNSAFVNIAVSKLNKSKEKKRMAALKRKQEPVKFHSPKRVAFEMSRTQIKPFRKTDKAIACSPSPTVIAFDPRKKPRCGLLKAVKSKKLHGSKASDFFSDA